ncbi:MAG TPA: exodeoxyribonuclease III [Bryobacteraceae bacterium]|nr:exodeoxyribonuclease III [Bryobacteraceae bacterium]
MMKIATWNINSIRRRLTAVLDWLEVNRPDVMCLQETKVQDSEFPAQAFRQAGYHATFRGMKGYNGIATLTRRTPDSVMYGLHEGPDNEDVRVLQTVLDGLAIVNTYVPQGYKVGSDKYQFKLEWFRRIRAYFDERLDPAGHVIWAGDMNVAPEPIDVYHPDRRLNDVDFHIDARNAYRNAVTWGFVDVFRTLHPDRIQYTYWDYFRNALENNWGWRIDHILATPSLARLCTNSDVDMEPRRAPGSSDHTVVWAEFDLP